MLKTKTIDELALALPAGLARKLKVKDGDSIEAVVKKGSLVFLKKKDKASDLMEFAGMWHDENVDEVFKDIRKNWDKWHKNLSV